MGLKECVDRPVDTQIDLGGRLLEQSSISGHLYLYIRGAHISTVTWRVSSPLGDLVCLDTECGLRLSFLVIVFVKKIVVIRVCEFKDMCAHLFHSFCLCSSGNLLQLNEALSRNEAFFIKFGIYLILEKLKIITYRNLFKKV